MGDVVAKSSRLVTLSLSRQAALGLFSSIDGALSGGPGRDLGQTWELPRKHDFGFGGTSWDRLAALRAGQPAVVIRTVEIAVVPTTWCSLCLGGVRRLGPEDKTAVPQKAWPPQPFESTRQGHARVLSAPPFPFLASQRQKPFPQQASWAGLRSNAACLGAELWPNIKARCFSSMCLDVS